MGKVVLGGTIKTSITDNDESSALVYIHIRFESFKIYGFLNDTRFHTTAPGREARRVYSFSDDIQRAFYSGHFSGHGIKAKAVSLPNSILWSMYLESWRVSDSCLLNIDELDNCLTNLFHETGIIIPGDVPSLPVLYGNGAFPCLPTILHRYSDPNVNERRINTRLSSVRQSIEHIFGIHKNIFHLFHQPERFKLLHLGVDAIQLIVNSFILLNCDTCFNESAYECMLRASSMH